MNLYANLEPHPYASRGECDRCGHEGTRRATDHSSTAGLLCVDCFGEYLAEEEEAA